MFVSCTIFLYRYLALYYLLVLMCYKTKPTNQIMLLMFQENSFRRSVTISWRLMIELLTWLYQ